MEPYRVWTDIDVRFRDTDAMGHINNAVYLTYLEVARQVYWSQVDPGRSFDRVPFILAHTSIDFRRSATVHDAIRVFIRTTWVGRRSFGMRYEVRARDRDALFADAESVLVTYDYESEQSIPMPETLRRALDVIEGRTLPPKPSPATR